MIFIIVTFILTALYIFNAIIKTVRIPRGLKQIPLERGLPVIGILHKINDIFPFYLKKLGEKHGSIFRVMLGMRDMLVLNDFDTIKRFSSDKEIDDTGRWFSQMHKIVFHDSGILYKDGEVWLKQRTFILRVLRDFGFGKSRSLEIIQSECIELLKELESLNGKNADFSQIIPYYTQNIISQFIMNKRFAREDPKLQFFRKLIYQVAEEITMVELFHLLFPIGDYIGIFAKIMKRFSTILKRMSCAQMLIKEEIDEHKERLKFNSEGEDLIDRFLIEQHKLKEKTGSVDTFTDNQLIQNAFELYAAGYETTSRNLGWSMMFMAQYPDIQNRVYDEIVDKIGTERLPTMNDKKSLNYIQAVMDEIMRLSSIVAIPIFHRLVNDISIDGYFIPKNTLIITNLLACHTDPKVWKKPMEFYPEHFLLSDENREEKYNCREELIPFGIGKRQCLGESLARMEYLIFFLSIIQRFEVKFAEDIDDETFRKAVKGNNSLLRSSNITNFVFRRRI